MTVEGVDYSYDPPSPSGLAAAGKKFAVRYGALGNSAKFLTAAEVAALKAAGLDIVANVEETARAFRGSAAGVRHAKAGEAFFRPLGMGADRPIYFPVDWDAGPADWAAIDDALRGAVSVIGAGRVGVYGGYDTIAHCASAGTAAWFWQTYAWSGGRWHPRCHLQQYKNGVALAGGTVDYDRAMVVDYGQWGAHVATSQNGWPVDTSGDLQDRADIYPGIAVPNGVRQGDVAVIFRYLARRFHAEVEPLHAGWCWGWYVKTIEGGTSISNHASGTAIDLNAPEHPVGAVDTFSATQQAAIDRILDDLGGVVRWGGHYTVRKDDMHFEINAGADAVKAQADRIRGLEANDVSEADVTNALEKFFARGKQPDGTVTSRIGRDAWDQGIPNPLGSTKGPAWVAMRDLATAVKALAAQVGTLNVDDLDEQELADRLLAGLQTVPDDRVVQALRLALGDRAAVIGAMLTNASG